MSFTDKIKDGSARIGILGLGYVGLPLVLEFGKRFGVAGLDTDPKKVQALNRGESYIGHIPAESIGRMRAGDACGPAARLVRGGRNGGGLAE